MKFKWLLFDADNTLLDFNKASKESLWAAFSAFDLHCDEDIYQLYQGINHRLWHAFEQGEVSAVFLRTERFRQLLEALKIKDITPALFSQTYMNSLVEVSEIYAGVEGLLQDLKGKYQLSIITNGLKEAQKPRLNKLQLTHYFESIVVSDEIGVAKPDLAYFEYVYQSIVNPPPKSDILVIGDSLKSDILGGFQFGIKTCWISHGKENNTAIQPDYIIDNVLELPTVL